MRRVTRDRTVPPHLRYQVLDPVIAIEPGETIVVETINHMTPIVWSESDLHHYDSPEYREREETGPIYVNGAQPGDMLAIHVDNIDIIGLPHAHGGGPLRDRFPEAPIAFPIREGRCRYPGGLSAPVAPMIGDIYTTPLDSCRGNHFDHGGNMDFTEIRPGNTLYLPVYRQGALLVLGDVHAVQGDGELAGEGGEAAADVTVTISIDNTYRSDRPVVETPDSIICLAERGSLWESLRLAMEDLVALVSRLCGVTDHEAHIFCSSAGSLRIAGSMARREWTEQGCLVGIAVPRDIKP